MKLSRDFAPGVRWDRAIVSVRMRNPYEAHPTAATIICPEAQGFKRPTQPVLHYTAQPVCRHRHCWRGACYHRRVAAVLYALICLIWGSTWLAIKVGLAGVPPFLAAGVRFLLSAAIVG